MDEIFDAISKKNLTKEMLKEMLKESLCNINDFHLVFYNYGHTALTYACKYKYVKGVKMLLETGADPNMKNKFGETPLIVASRIGGVNIVALLIKRGSIINIKNDYGFTPLLLATAYKHKKIVALLLEAGADPNIRSMKYESPLNYASYFGYTKVVRVLIKYGAKLDEEAFSLQESLANGHIKIFKILTQHGARGPRNSCYLEYNPEQNIILNRIFFAVPFLKRSFRRVNIDIIHETLNNYLR
jgi:ankyrin repeat protein